MTVSLPATGILDQLQCAAVVWFGLGKKHHDLGYYVINVI